MDRPVEDLPMDRIEIDRRTTYHAPTEAAKAAHEQIGQAHRVAMATLVALCPEGREASRALTNLEQAFMWANAAVARNHDKLESKAKGEGARIRAEYELADLEARTERLSEFIEDAGEVSVFRDLSTEVQENLEVQHNLMAQLARVLRRRLRNW